MATSTRAGDSGTRRMSRWLLQGLNDQSQQHQGPLTQPTPQQPRHQWWKVMCLTGVDYFSSLGYQPGIAALAAGALSPIATLVLVLVTVAGALPVYRRVARESPRGEGSIAILEKFLPFWRGKILVLVLLGFAATDFLITMTLSAADASAHLIQNPYTPGLLDSQQVVVTLVLLALLGGVFLKGFTEAIGIAVVLVGAYLALNVVVVVASIGQIIGNPELVADWSRLLVAEHPNPLLMIGAALLVFPKLALGLSGFETGVAVMPLIKGDPGDDERMPEGRIRGARKLLTTAALIMSAFLIVTSFITVVLIPQREFEPGGEANGRALAYLAHTYLGGGFGTLYDVSTIAILWFAGASAMAGLLNLVPRYLPRYGMAPHWAQAVRPLVLVFTVVAFLVTILFDADVDAQGGAYATGVLVLITSASIAVTLSARRTGRRRRVVAGLAVIAVVFVYTTILNIVERPEGVKIASCFIGGILLVSFLSRVVRAFELRVTAVTLDEAAERFIREFAPGPIRLIAHEAGAHQEADYRRKIAAKVASEHIPDPDRVLFAEVTVTDPSDFESELLVTGTYRFGCRVLCMSHPSVPSAIAALLLHIRDMTGTPPHVYFDWSEGNPVVNLVRYLFFGMGEAAPVTREILREAEPDPHRRPVVHVD